MRFLLLCILVNVALVPMAEAWGVVAGETAGFVPSPPGNRGVPELTEFFSQQEMADWKEYAQQQRLFHWIGAGSTVLFYLIFLGFGLNRVLKTSSERAADRLYGASGLTAAGTRHPLLARLARIPERLFGDRQGLVVLVYCLSFICLFQMAFFPYRFYRSYWFEVRHGLSNYTLGIWLLDYAKDLVVRTAVFGFMVFGIYGLMRRVGWKWWLFVWAGVSLGIFGWAYVVPYRSMIYSNLTKLDDGEIRAGLEGLIHGQGLDVEDIYVEDASRRTRQVNAYVLGKGGSRRLVLFDSLLKQFTPGEINMIMAHELVHWKAPERKSQYLIFSLTVFSALLLVHGVLQWGSRVRFFHYSSFRDVAGLPLLFLAFLLIFMIIRPFNLYKKRTDELETDRKSFELVCDPAAFVGAHVKLARINRSEVDPNPLVVFLFYSHPPLLDRLQVAYSDPCTPTE